MSIISKFKTLKFNSLAQFKVPDTLFKITNYLNILNQAPSKQSPYLYQNKKFGQPSFRLKKRGGDVSIESDSFWFTKDEETQIIKLNCVIEIFREEEDVYPLLIKNPLVNLQYQLNGSLKNLPLKITQSPFISKVNILQNLHAEAEIKKEDITGLTEAISNMGMAKLNINSELWWQNPKNKPADTNKPRQKATPVVRKRKFDSRTLRVRGNNITDLKGNVYWTCKNRNEAIKAYKVLKIYAFDTEITVGKYRSFTYFLSRNNIPVAAKFNGEDVLPLIRSKVQLKKINNRWVITSGVGTHFNFNDDEIGAREALRVIMKYQVDFVGYALRPKPALQYLKSSNKKRAYSMGSTFMPQIQLAHLVNTVSTNKVKHQKTKPSKPEKIDLSHSIILFYDKEDPSVFGNLIDNITAVESKWKYKSIPKDGENFTIYYRGTAQPDTFSFLPQVYRIKVNENSGEPKVMITMISGEDPNSIEQYRIRVNIQLIPYYHPKAKKDLFKTLSDLTNGEVKHCNVVLDNYSSAAFEINDIEVSDLVALNANIPKKIENINPVNGFSISLDCTFESFDVLKRKLKDGFTVGSVIFELVEENEDGESIISSQPIPVELDLRKLAGIPIGIEVMETPNAEESSIPPGIILYNENSFPIYAKGVELTLLSEINDTVYEVDYDIGNTREDWPISISENKLESSEIYLKKSDIDELEGENRFWTDLKCEAYGVYINDEPDAIMERVIDYATGDPQIWELQIECFLFKSWEEIGQEMLIPYKGIQKVVVEIKQNEDSTPLSVVLSKENSIAKVQMARSISQILNSQQLIERKYQFRVKSYYLLEEKQWTEWKNPESTASNYLSIYPQKLEDQKNTKPE